MKGSWRALTVDETLRSTVCSCCSCDCTSDWQQTNENHSPAKRGSFVARDLLHVLAFVLDGHAREAGLDPVRRMDGWLYPLYRRDELTLLTHPIVVGTVAALAH